MSKQIQRSRRCTSSMVSCQKGWYKSSHTLVEVLPHSFEEDFRWLITLTEWDCLYIKISKCCHTSVNYCNRSSVAEIKSEYTEKTNSKTQVPMHAHPLFLLCAVAHCPQCPRAQARGDRRTHEEQVWLQIDFTHFWWPLSALELPCCSPRLLLDCVLSRSAATLPRISLEIPRYVVMFLWVLVLPWQAWEMDFRVSLKRFQGSSLVCLSLAAQLCSLSTFLVALGSSSMTLVSNLTEVGLPGDTCSAIAVK